ncbi:CDP-glucose 4,6-dehydratase [Marinoscillum sp. 108]|nr:CDP-glucose 4,6-dehydratase [Marinoscillum sp. 108]
MTSFGVENYFREKYAGKRVFITGHTGFKGSWLTTWLIEIGAIVKGYSLEPVHGLNLFESLEIKGNHESKIGDIRDYERLESEVVDFEPDYVFHLAAQPLVRYSYDYPIDTYQTNVIGTGNLLMAIKKLDNPCAIVLITTDKVYLNNEWHYPYRETDRLGGYDPYSSSKACCELLIDSFRNSYFNLNQYQYHQKAIAVARAGNVIGGGDWSRDRIIPDIVKALRSNKTVEMRNPRAVRPWQHVIEPLAGYLLLGARLSETPCQFAKAWNFGPLLQDNITVNKLVDHAIEIWGSGTSKDISNDKDPHEAGLLKLDINKTLNELGWKPKFDSKEAIHLTIQWYKDFISGQNSKDLLLKDISKYLKKAE